ncbi:MAG: trypsin [Chloroflexi bacterium]|jgi:S1-C subfamily serine protease|nr:trypsin [Chloroflexota bacterium]MDP7195079.1 trypsin-like peptidase domain-containing protein [SAR202 cluster bacterium]|tara:strand:- start:2257 stop:3408 length:1152 start_codon:yes stop_codon:yes gene_type:complete
MKTLITIISTLLLIACSTGLNSNQDASSESITNQFLVNNSEAKNKFNNLQLLKAKESQLNTIYSTSLPSIVHIKVRQTGSGFFQNQERTGEGSGFIWDTEGHIVTNYHVVASASIVDVEFADGAQYLASVIGLDPNSDLAILKVNSNGKILTPLNLGDSTNVKVGNHTIVIGSPFGQEFSMSSGIVSAIKRTVPSQNTVFSIPNVIQTDAAINPGNSGGPLMDIDGNVIGINSQIMSRSGGNAGIGFAIPINSVKKIIPTLIRGEKFEYPYIGITAMDLNSNLKNVLEIDSNVDGVMVIDIVKDSPADLGGLLGYTGTVSDNNNTYPSGGDILTAINTIPIKSMSDLLTLLFSDYSPGDSVTFTIFRDSNSLDLDITLIARPQ